MTKPKRILFSLLLVIITYVLVETASLGIYAAAWQTGFSFSIPQANRVAIISSRSRLASREFGAIPVGHPPGKFYEVLHPYLGFVYDPTKSPGLSEYGFPDTDVRVYPRDPKRLIVGVFGGSFARGMSQTAEAFIMTKLKAVPQFADTQIIVLTMAVSGYKQPQQLLSLAYLLSLGSHFDIIVNLDGFNELVLPIAENIPKHVFPFYPRNWFSRVGGYDHALLVLLAKHAAALEARKDWAVLFAHTPLRFSITANVLWKVYDEVLVQKIARIQLAALNHHVPDKATLGYTVRGPRFPALDEAAIYNALADMWKTASVQMHGLASANGSLYLHFLQPNQYLAGAKPLHREEEQQQAYQRTHPYRRGVELGYPKLIERGQELKQEGVLFYDLSMIFANHEEPLYVDACCHLGRGGYQIIAAFITDKITQQLQ